MFTKTEGKGQPVARAVASPSGTRVAPSIISTNLHIVGNLKTEGEIQVDGTINGDVAAQSLTIGNHARISGELVADEVVVHGQIDGKVTARSVKLVKTAKVVGDIVHEVLAIEAGAHIEGQFRRLEEGKNPRQVDMAPAAAEGPKLAATSDLGAAKAAS